MTWFYLVIIQINLTLITPYIIYFDTKYQPLLVCGLLAELYHINNGKGRGKRCVQERGRVWWKTLPALYQNRLSNRLKLSH